MNDGAIKAVGEYQIQVALHPDVVSDVTVKVEGELV
ncbi:MAG TPA: 50S ribosomal L9 C-terminal domain-containing protein, partial [Orrella sp.]